MKTELEYHKHMDEAWRADRILIVTGPPGSGKTTYCRENRKHGDIVLDLDYIAAALEISRPGHQDRSGVIRTALAVYDFLIDAIDKGSLTYSRAFIITTNQARQIQAKTGGRIIRIDPGIEETMRRIESDPDCTVEERMHRKDQALKYYYQHQRRKI